MDLNEHLRAHLEAKNQADNDRVENLCLEAWVTTDDGYLDRLEIAIDPTGIRGVACAWAPPHVWLASW